MLLRADSAFYGHAVVAAAHRAGAKVSVTARMDPAVKRAISTISDDAWETIQYTDAIRDEATGKWISSAEVAEVAFTAFRSRKRNESIEGRLIVRRIPELNGFEGDGQPTLFDTHRFHAFFTTSTLDAVTADKTHRGHAIIEQINADLKDSALAHLPSGVFTANVAWLVLATIAFNLSRAVGALTGLTSAKRAAAQFAANSSRSRHESRPRPDASCCTCQPLGPGKPGGRHCSQRPAARRKPRPSDHPAPRHNQDLGYHRQQGRMLRCAPTTPTQIAPKRSHPPQCSGEFRLKRPPTIGRGIRHQHTGVCRLPRGGDPGLPAR